LRVTDIHDSDDPLQTAASIVEYTTPSVSLEVETENHNHNDLYEDLPGQRNNNNPIDNDIGDPYFEITDEDRIDVETKI
jgi:hypothetical protein